MDPFPEDNILVADGDFYLPKARHPGRPVSIEVAGVFDGATVIPGYVSTDVVPIYIVDVGDDAIARPKSAPGRWVSSLPTSGQCAVRISGAGGSTAIKIDVQDLLPR